MTEIDESGMYELLNGVVKRAHQDARRGKPEVAADAAEFLTDLAGDSADRMPDWYESMKRRLDALESRIAGHSNGTTTSAPKPAPKRESPFENLTAERLDAVGVSPLWAGMTGEQLAELERNQAHRDRAARLGVDPKYLPKLED